MAEKPSNPIDQTLKLAAPFTLHHGDVLADAKIAYRLIGPESAPVIAVLQFLSP